MKVNESKCECDFCGRWEETTNKMHLVNDDNWMICDLCMFMMHRTKLEEEE